MAFQFLICYTSSFLPFSHHKCDISHFLVAATCGLTVQISRWVIVKIYIPGNMHRLLENPQFIEDFPVKTS